MPTASPSKSLNQYIQQTQKLSMRVANNPDAMEDLAQLIRDQIDLHKNESPLLALFQGELAFYQKKYEQALPLYLKADLLEEAPFFIYRCSAFSYHDQKDYEKAYELSKKALNLVPKDYLTLTLHEELLTKTKRESQVEKVQSEIASLQLEKESPTSQFSYANLNPISKQKEEYTKRRQKQIQAYLGKKSAPIEKTVTFFGQAQDPSPLSGDPYTPTGFYIRWEGIGIAINPGHDFVNQLHSQNLSLRDIDHVIVTQCNENAYAGLKRLTTLNAELNAYGTEPHLIHYWIHYQIHPEISRIINPHLKEESDCIHSLNLSVDTSDLERRELSPEITLHYFPTTRQDLFLFDSALRPPTPLGFCIDLKKEDQSSIRIGYVSGAPWSPLMAHNLGECDYLIAGFGHTHSNDYHMHQYHESCLGYYGTFTLMNEIYPKALFCCEFDGQGGDIRLEVCRKLKKELQETHEKEIEHSSVIPTDSGLIFHLVSEKVLCSADQTWTDIKRVKVVKEKAQFGKLQYLTSEYFFNE